MQKTKPSIESTTHADFMRNATISDSTRDYLLVWGQFEDLADKFYNLYARDWGTDEAENMLSDNFAKPFDDLKKVLLDTMDDKIKMNFSELNRNAV